MPIFERLAEKATHPLLADIVRLINRDESRHVAFGVLYVAEYLQASSPDERQAFARRWLPRIVGILRDRGPGVPRLTTARLRAAGVADAEAVALRMAEEQREIDREERAADAAGRRVPHLLGSARRAGLLAPDLLGPLGLADHPLVLRALHAPAA
jgi:hypothetical protein